MVKQKEVFASLKLSVQAAFLCCFFFLLLFIYNHKILLKQKSVKALHYKWSNLGQLGKSHLFIDFFFYFL